MPLERFPFAWRIANAKSLHRLTRDAAFLQVSPSCRALLAQQRFHIEPCRELTGLREAFALGALALHGGVVDLLRHCHTRAGSKMLHCLMKRHMLHVHDKLDHGAADMAAKAIV